MTRDQDEAERKTSHPAGCRNSLLSFTVFISVSFLMCECIRTYIASQITSLEKQFSLSSKRSGLLVATEDVGYLLVILFVGHFGRFGHIPRILAISVVIIGVSALLTGASYWFSPVTLPQDGSYNATGRVRGGLCLTNEEEYNDGCGGDADAVSTKSSGWVVGFLMAMGILQGFGQPSRFSLGPAFVEDNAVDKPQSTRYNGAILTVNFFGTAIAMGFGSFISQIPVDLSDTNLSPYHPEWIGAWWLGYLILGGLTVLAAVPVFLYPRTFGIHQAIIQDNGKENLSLKQKLSDLPKCLGRLFRNPVYLCLLVANTAICLFLAGSMAFDPKYTELQFMIPAYQSNIILGSVGIVCLLGGNIGGTYIVSRLRLSNEGCLKFAMICMSVACASFFLLLIFGCNNSEVIGLADNVELKTATCFCDVDEYFPLCGEDGRVYKSPCFAGCTTKNGTVYGGCTEIPGGQGVAGLCTSECSYLYYYIAVEMLSGVMGSLPMMAIMVTIMRCVRSQDKAMAMATSSFLQSILGFLPAPIVYGAVIDSACKVWDVSCGEKGACSLYDLQALRFRVKGIDVGFQLLALLMYVLAYLLYRFRVVPEEPDSGNEDTRCSEMTVMSSVM